MFPLLYHLHHSLNSKDIPMWLELAKEHPGPILELGCGTGRVLIPIAEAGFQICGIDKDFQILTFLREHLNPSLIRRINYFQGDFTHFHLDSSFSLILLPCNTYSELSREERLSVLKHAYHHLRSGGIFILSVPNPYVLLQLPADSPPEVEEVISHPLNDTPVQISSAWKRTNDFFIVSWHYDLLLPNGNIKRLSAQAKHFLISFDTYLDEVQQTNLNTEAVYGNYDFSAFTPNSPHLIIQISR